MADGPAAMRFDRFLWWTRLTKTRSIAQALAEGGRCRIDGRRIERAHCPVRVGDTLTFLADDAVRVVRIAALPARRGPPPEARACYRELTANVSQEGATD